ncbi:hypothetical protein [Halobacillus seohaensis]|uniref:DUF3139 domain-containing protein n=1 Tax=Halobacillus seohaensis TaxID=447421 RepID=A0ABW2EJ22_9BACI
MLKAHPFNWIATIVVIVAIGIWLFISFGYIHEEHLTEATIEEKSHNEDSYYITVDGEKILVEDTNLWMVLEEEKEYEITYEWYATKQPTVVNINQPHDEDSVGGGH